MSALDQRARGLPFAVLSETRRGSEPAAPRVAPAGSADSPARLDASDFPRIYREQFAFVWRAVAHRGVPSAALDDVVQEVFIVVHRKLPEFEGRSSLRTWIAGVIRRVVADYVRKRGNQPAGEPLEREPAAQHATSEQLERNAAISLLEALLTKMTPEQREVFLLHELEHMSGAEIAAITGSNENTVWTRLRAARRIFEQGVARDRARQSREQT